MAYFMGIDLGTSSLKTLLIDEDGTILSVKAKDYQFASPFGGYAEHDPKEWWGALVETVQGVLAESGISGEEIRSLSFSGQMHGAVLLDKEGHPLRPAILHCDARSGEEVEKIRKALGEDVERLMMNPVYSGFLFVSLLWVREHEPELFEKIRYVMLPKDYLKYRLTGEISSDYSDASATLCFDVEKNCWSEEILTRFCIPQEIFPPLTDVSEAVGHVTAQAAEETGLSQKTLVVAGGGDQVMQGIGNGVVHDREACINIGTSGQVSFQSDIPIHNPKLSTNTFCGYKRGRWITMGAIMNAGLCLKWWNNLLQQKDYAEINRAAGAVAPGSGGVVFLPYLNGERTPHLDPDLSGVFYGVNLKTGRAEMTRAVMEGVTYALYQCFELCGDLGLTPEGAIVSSGGGARSPLWLQIQADVFDNAVKVAQNEEQACLGAAIAAGCGAGVYSTIEEGCARVVRYKDLVVEPDRARHEIYKEYYQIYKDIFAAGGRVLHDLTILGRRDG
ncbi:MAG: xylulokinase [Lachnospiraceae bacterium]|nr:xylulokinase [Lachnospiraceae bacterium]